MDEVDRLNVRPTDRPTDRVPDRPTVRPTVRTTKNIPNWGSFEVFGHGHRSSSLHLHSGGFKLGAQLRSPTNDTSEKLELRGAVNQHPMDEGDDPPERILRGHRKAEAQHAVRKEGLHGNASGGRFEKHASKSANHHEEPPIVRICFARREIVDKTYQPRLEPYVFGFHSFLAGTDPNDSKHLFEQISEAQMNER